MASYGLYPPALQAAIKARNPELIGHMRHFDEIVSHGKNRHVVRGFMADRGLDGVVKGKYYQAVDGGCWGLGEMQVVRLALDFRAGGKEEEDGATGTSGGGGEGMRTDWVVGASPPGFHLPEWERKMNPAFEPIVAVDAVQG